MHDPFKNNSLDSGLGKRILSGYITLIAMTIFVGIYALEQLKPAGLEVKEITQTDQPLLQSISTIKNYKLHQAIAL